MQVNLTQVNRYTTKKDGSPLMTSKGKPYTSLRIKTQEHGDKVLSGFDSDRTMNWKEGDSVEIEVEQKGEYLNFSLPKFEKNGGSSSEVMHELSKIQTTLGLINFRVEALYELATKGAKKYVEEQAKEDEEFIPPAF